MGRVLGTVVAVVAGLALSACGSGSTAVVRTQRTEVDPITTLARATTSAPAATNSSPEQGETTGPALVLVDPSDYLTSPRDFPDGASHLAPPVGSRFTAVPKEVALQPVDAAGGAVPIDAASADPVVKLALYTNDVTSRGDASGSTTSLLYQKRLVWAVIVDGIPGDRVPRSGPSRADGVVPSPDTGTYTYLLLVDAKTGSALLGAFMPQNG